MAEIKEQFNNTNGIENAAVSSKYNTSVCIQASSYNYTAVSSIVNSKDYLRGSTSTQTNAFGGSWSCFWWGRAGALSDIYTTAFRYETSVGVSSVAYQVPFVYYKYGLLPTKATSSSSNSPFTVNRTFTSKIYLRYDSSTDKCQYRRPDSASTMWTDLNDGPGVFFIMAGGGGAGGNAKATWGIGYCGLGGSGGGGGASCIGYMDLKMLDKTIVFEPGSAGQHNTDMNAKGGNGGDSLLRYYNGSNLLLCEGGYGGNGGGSYGGNGGKLPTNNSAYIHLFNSFTGKTGGRGENITTGNNGGSFDSSITLSPSGEWSLMNSNNIPYENNGVYGNGSNYYNTTPSGYAECTAAGGGGGASIMSTSGSTVTGYGSGGYGGNARTGAFFHDNDGWWNRGVNGTQGALYILNISL